MNQSLHLPAFRQLPLSQLRARARHLETCLQSIIGTLKSLCLEYIWFCGTDDYKRIMEFLHEELDLDELTLRRLNFKFIGMNLECIRTLRPGTPEYEVQSQIGDDGWVLV